MHFVYPCALTRERASAECDVRRSSAKGGGGRRGRRTGPGAPFPKAYAWGGDVAPVPPVGERWGNNIIYGGGNLERARGSRWVKGGGEHPRFSWPLVSHPHLSWATNSSGACGRRGEMRTTRGTFRASKRLSLEATPAGLSAFFPSKGWLRVRPLPVTITQTRECQIPCQVTR